MCTHSHVIGHAIDTQHWNKRTPGLMCNLILHDIWMTIKWPHVIKYIYKRSLSTFLSSYTMWHWNSMRHNASIKHNQLMFHEHIKTPIIAKCPRYLTYDIETIIWIIIEKLFCNFGTEKNILKGPFVLGTLTLQENKHNQNLHPKYCMFTSLCACQELHSCMVVVYFCFHRNS